MATILSSKKSTYGSPYAYYTVSVIASNRKENSVKLTFTVSCKLAYSSSLLGTGYGLKAGVYVDGEWHTATLKSTDSSWSGTSAHTCEISFTVSGLSWDDTSLSVKFRCLRTDSYGDACELSSTSCSAAKFSTYPVPTTPSIDLDSVEMGKSIVISMPRKASSFTHTLTYSFAGASGTIGTELGTSKSWTVPLSLADKIPNATSGTITVTCKTYDGDGDLIGTKTDTVKVTVPSTVVPSINDVDITEAVAAVTNAFGDIFMQNLSQLNISVDASGARGSTIKSYSVKLDGVTYIQQAFTSNVIRTAGELSVEVSVTDSRGRKDSETYKVDVVEYSQPVVTDLSYMHCDQDGTQNSSGSSTKVTISGRVYPVNELNTKALKLLYKATTEAVYTERVIEITDWTFSTDVIINNTDPTVTYEYVAQLCDKINAASPVTHRITTGVLAFSRLAGGKGVTFFGEAEEDGLVLKGDNPFKIISEIAAAGTRQNINFIGYNPLSSSDEDTPAFWKAQGTGIAYIGKSGLIKNQPYTYGYIVNRVYGNLISQTFIAMDGPGRTFHREGNANGWYSGSGDWPMYIDENHTFKTLWDGSWSKDSITIENADKYKMFLIAFSGHGTFAVAINQGNNYVRGVGGYVNDTPTNFTYHFAATLSNSGKTWKYVGAGYMYHSGEGSHGPNNSGLTVSSIIGII